MASVCPKRTAARDRQHLKAGRGAPRPGQPTAGKRARSGRSEARGWLRSLRWRLLEGQLACPAGLDLLALAAHGTRFAAHDANGLKFHLADTIQNYIEPVSDWGYTNLYSLAKAQKSVSSRIALKLFIGFFLGSFWNSLVKGPVQGLVARRGLFLMTSPAVVVCDAPSPRGSGFSWVLAPLLMKWVLLGAIFYAVPISVAHAYKVAKVCEEVAEMPQQTWSQPGCPSRRCTATARPPKPKDDAAPAHLVCKVVMVSGQAEALKAPPAAPAKH